MRGMDLESTRDGKCFPFTSFFAQKGHASLMPRGNCHERILNIKYCICRDRGIGYEDVQIKLEILQVPISLQVYSHSLVARLPPLEAKICTVAMI
jgi:hypothetical protein